LCSVWRFTCNPWAGTTNGFERAHCSHADTDGFSGTPPHQLVLFRSHIDLRTALVDEYANEKAPTDGEVYRKIRQYQHESNAPGWCLQARVSTGEEILRRKADHPDIGQPSTTGQMDISPDLRTALVDEYANEKAPTDGEVYRKIRQYQHPVHLPISWCFFVRIFIDESGP
jgi:hypothetical protein